MGTADDWDGVPARRVESSHEWETPHPELVFEAPMFEPWTFCPECNSRRTLIQMRELDDDATVWFQSSVVVWLKCERCGHECRPRAGDYVEQPETSGAYSLREQFKEWIAGL